VNIDGIVIIEDKVDMYYPLSLSTPLSDLIVGGLRVYEHVALWAMRRGIEPEIYVITRDYLARNWRGVSTSLIERIGFKFKINYLSDTVYLPHGEYLFMNSSLLPTMDQLDKLAASNALVTCGSSLIGGIARESRSSLSDCSFKVMEGIWSLIKHNTDLLRTTIRILGEALGEFVVESDVDHSVRIQGDVVVLGSVVEPFTVIRGPTLLGHGAHVAPGTYIREGSVLYMGNVVGGEVKNSIIEEYSAKPHFGYLGDSYVGRWVNLGAGSVTSNLKNTRGTVKYMGIDTGMVKLGSIVADWAKVGINTSILGGRYVGQCSSVMGLVDRDIPPFSMCINSACSEYSLDKAIEVHRRFLKSRGLDLGEGELSIIKEVFARTRNPTP